MRRILLLGVAFPVFGVSCVDKGTDTADSSDTGDSGDTGETGDTGDSCAGGELVYSVEVHNPAGEACTTCPAGEGLTLHSRITNPASEDVDLWFRTGCVVGSWSVADNSGVVWSDSPGCTEAEEVRTIPACGALEDAWTTSPVVLAAGSYTLTARFEDEPNTEATVSFATE